MQLSTLTDSELLQHAWASHDSLTRTELEAELLKRFEEMAEQVAQARALVEAGIPAEKAVAVFEVLDNFEGATEPATLRELLQRAETFAELADEAGDLFTRLTELAAKATA